MKRIHLADLAELVTSGKIQAAEYCWRCNKIRYPSREAARSVGARMAALGKGHTRAYKCRRGGWHLTAKVSKN